MIRKLFALAAAMSAVLCAASVLLWVRSFRVCDRFALYKEFHLSTDPSEEVAAPAWRRTRAVALSRGVVFLKWQYWRLEMFSERPRPYGSGLHWEQTAPPPLSNELTEIRGVGWGPYIVDHYEFAGFEWYHRHTVDTPETDYIERSTIVRLRSGRTDTVSATALCGRSTTNRTASAMSWAAR